MKKQILKLVMSKKYNRFPMVKSTPHKNSKMAKRLAYFFIPYNHCDQNIGDISGALFTLSLSILILNSKYEEGARDFNNI